MASAQITSRDAAHARSFDIGSRLEVVELGWHGTTKGRTRPTPAPKHPVGSPRSGGSHARPKLAVFRPNLGRFRPNWPSGRSLTNIGQHLPQISQFHLTFPKLWFRSGLSLTSSVKVCRIWQDYGLICPTSAKCRSASVNLGRSWGESRLPEQLFDNLTTFGRRLGNSGARRDHGGEFSGRLASNCSAMLGKLTSLWLQRLLHRRRHHDTWHRLALGSASAVWAASGRKGALKARSLTKIGCSGSSCGAEECLGVGLAGPGRAGS